MKSLLLLFVVFAAWVSVALGAVSLTPLKDDIQYGKTVKYCEYGKLKLLPKSKIKNMETCELCICKNSGLHCSTMGMSITYPSDSKCEYVKVGCKGRWVRKSNTSRRCPKRHIPTNISAVGK